MIYLAAFITLISIIGAAFTGLCMMADIDIGTTTDKDTAI